MTDTIRSRLHDVETHVSQMLKGGTLPQRSRAQYVAASLILATARKLPHYVFEPELGSILEDQSVQKTVDAMFRAGVGGLPYLGMFLELWGGSNQRVLTIVQQGDGIRRFKIVSFLYVQTPEPRISYIVEGDVEYLVEEEWRASREVLREVAPGEHLVGGGRWKTTFKHDPAISSAHGDVDQLLVRAISSLALALVSSHLSELDREVVDPVRLNRTRTNSGKMAIPTHTVVRVRHVYDREGHRIPISRSGDRKTVAIHMRAGYTRRQPHGEQWRIEHPELAHMLFYHEDHHPAWIAPVLVNYRDGEELPPPLPKVLKL